MEYNKEMRDEMRYNFNINTVNILMLGIVLPTLMYWCFFSLVCENS